VACPARWPKAARLWLTTLCALNNQSLKPTVALLSHHAVLQLEHSKDVVAQAQAVVGLSGQMAQGSPAMADYIATVLAGVMRNPAVFCRWDAIAAAAAAVEAAAVAAA
jgi:hypothetical protein